MDPITPQHHPVPIIPGNGTHDAFNNYLISMSDGSTSRYGLDNIQKCGSIINILPPCSNFFFNSNNPYDPYDPGSSSYSGLPSTLYTNQSGSSLPRTPQVRHEPQGRTSTLPMMTDMPPMYYRNPILDESAPVSSSSSNGKLIKSGRSQIPAKTGVAQPEVELTSTAIPGRHEENISDWDSGYLQPLRFVPIV
jgi:hypothetical protein